MKLHHIGYIVANAEDPSSVQEGLHPVASAMDPLQTAKICLYKNEQDEWIELIQPLNEKSPVWNFLQKKGNAFHHQCFESTEPEIEKHCAKNKLVKIMGPVPASIFPGYRILFYISRSKDIVEFIFKA